MATTEERLGQLERSKRTWPRTVTSRAARLGLIA